MAGEHRPTGKPDEPFSVEPAWRDGIREFATLAHEHGIRFIIRLLPVYSGDAPKISTPFACGPMI
jgi:hypothetical protein